MAKRNAELTLLAFQNFDDEEMQDHLDGHASSTLNNLIEIDIRLTDGEGWKEFLRSVSEEPVDPGIRLEWFEAMSSKQKRLAVRIWGRDKIKTFYEEAS